MKVILQRVATLLVGAAIAVGTVSECQAVELKGPPQASTESGTVVVSWTTDTLCGTRMAYGTSPQLLNKKAEGAVGLYHKVTLDDLKPGTKYNFSLGTSKRWLSSGTITLSGDGKVVFLPEGSAPTTTPSTGPPNTTAAGTANPSQSGGTSRPLPKLDDSPKSAAETKETPRTAAPKPAPPPAIKAPPTRETWGNLGSLQDHYERHGGDFRCTSPDDYAAKAWMFLQYARKNGLPMKWDDSDGTLRIWEPKSRAFAAFNRDGTTKTFFRPSNPSYWTRQPGRPVKSSDLPF